MKTLLLEESRLAEIAGLIAQLLPEGGVIVLRGDLASGKTTLVKAVAKEFGIDEPVTSPTFSLQQCYGGEMFHYDIYNKGFEHFLALGMMEELERPGYHFIEWGDDALIFLLKEAQMPHICIDINKYEENKREYKVTHA